MTLDRRGLLGALAGVVGLSAIPASAERFVKDAWPPDAECEEWALVCVEDDFIRGRHTLRLHCTIRGEPAWVWTKVNDRDLQRDYYRTVHDALEEICSHLRVLERGIPR